MLQWITLPEVMPSVLKRLDFGPLNNFYRGVKPMGQESSTTTTTAGINVFLSTKAENMNIVVYSLYVLHFASFKPLNTQQILTGRYIYGVSLIYFSFNVNLAWLYLYQFLQEVPYA